MYNFQIQISILMIDVCFTNAISKFHAFDDMREKFKASQATSVNLSKPRRLRQLTSAVRISLQVIDSVVFRLP
ncbi:hypothetical protein [Candidatus Enterovibrio escicola]|uniref:hypothetical protein n=1 Tax=Candidatus Enterovibrio escicola TaxID=1927127 RepID=UPI003C1300D3